MKLSSGYAFMVAVLTVSAAAQQAGTWTVKPEWVRAHEEFLASDAMHGRGSATHDEEITATYVASEFRAYGLKPAPEMPGYIQSAEVVSPVLDGHAALSAQSVSAAEGTDLQLLASSGESVSGSLVHVSAKEVGAAKIDRNSVVLLTGLAPGQGALGVLRSVWRQHPAVLVLEQGEETQQLSTIFGGKTHVSIHLKEMPAEFDATIVALSGKVFSQLEAAKDGERIGVAVHTTLQTAPRMTYNAIGYLEGSDPKSGTILLTAHLDHLGVGSAVNGDAIFNGANDDAAGTTAVLELAHALAAGPRLKRNVLFVCYGSEEIGELGSTYFGMHPPVPLKDLVTNLEFEMIGAQDPKMPKGVLLLTGWERSNLGPTLKKHGALVGPDPYPEQHFFERSDNYALALKGVVAHTAAGWGTPPTYHQPDDDLAHLDLPFMTAAIQSLVEPVRWLADSDFRPEWVPGGAPKN
ncbi:M28 family peptidase [Granulicella sp. S156]|uniref:M28 family peptidase n=1 Tax=Granulicella sp. S156 TaxID=1747224 RepID=UPI0020B176BA|nr:M28 family peptidase [Granulicella sp. S156]